MEVENIHLPTLGWLKAIPGGWDLDIVSEFFIKEIIIIHVHIGIKYLIVF